MENAEPGNYEGDGNNKRIKNKKAQNTQPKF
jgi:hypothetical protein